jgi:hypothetical protein
MSLDAGHPAVAGVAEPEAAIRVTTAIRHGIPHTETAAKMAQRPAGQG